MIVNTFGVIPSVEQATRIAEDRRAEAQARETERQERQAAARAAFARRHHEERLRTLAVLAAAEGAVGLDPGAVESDMLAYRYAQHLGDYLVRRGSR